MFFWFIKPFWVLTSSALQTKGFHKTFVVVLGGFSFNWSQSVFVRTQWGISRPEWVLTQSTLHAQTRGPVALNYCCHCQYYSIRMIITSFRNNYELPRRYLPPHYEGRCPYFYGTITIIPHYSTWRNTRYYLHLQCKCCGSLVSYT